MPYPRTTARARRTDGFTLIEVIVVVSIIAILVTLALPRLSVFIAKSRQAEAKQGLTAIRALQMSYYSERGTFLSGAGGAKAAAPNDCMDEDIQTLGFKIDCVKSRYEYSAPYGDNIGFTIHAFSTKNGLICDCARPLYGLAYDGWGTNETGAIYSSFGDLAIFKPGTTHNGDCTKSCF